MDINVAQLLKAPTGTTREYKVDEEIEFGEDSSKHPVKGDVKLTRTQRGILVQARLDVEAELTCSRCLTVFGCPLSLDIEEEYIPSIDIISGVPLSAPDDESAESALLIDEHHVLDLTEAVRQYTLLAAPMKPLCREDCAWLCQTCGQNLNHGACQCPKQDIDPRWADLTKLKK